MNEKLTVQEVRSMKLKLLHVGFGFASGFGFIHAYDLHMFRLGTFGILWRY